MFAAKYLRTRRDAFVWSVNGMVLLLLAACTSNPTPVNAATSGSGGSAISGAPAAAVSGAMAVSVATTAGAGPSAGQMSPVAGTIAGLGTAGAMGAMAGQSGSAAPVAGQLATAGTSAQAGVAGAANVPAAGSGAAACGGESFAAIFTDIISNPLYSCAAATCHGRVTGLADVGNLDLSTPAKAYAGLVGKNSDSAICAGKPRIKPGDAKASLFVSKLRDETVDCGGVMPAGGDMLADTELMRVVDWINAGACNN